MPIKKIEEIPIKGLSKELQLIIFFYQEYKSNNKKIAADQIFKRFPPPGSVSYNLDKLTKLEFLKKEILNGTSQKLGQSKVIYSINPDRLPDIEQYLKDNLSLLKPLFSILFADSPASELKDKNILRLFEDLKFELKSYLEDLKIENTPKQVRKLYEKIYHFFLDNS